MKRITVTPISLDYRLSTDIADLNDYLLNTRTGELYQVDKDGREIINSLLNQALVTPENNQTFQFMIQEGILVSPNTKKDKDKFHLQWHIINTCNLRCKHCYDWKSKVEFMTHDQMLNTVDNYVTFLKKMELEGEISLTGGEPMLYEKLSDLIEYIKSRDVFISTYILSNGTIPFKTNFVKLLKKYDVGVQVSIDGMEDKHELIRGSGNFKKSINAIENLLSNNINTSVHYVIMKRNVDDVIPFIQKMEEIGIKRIHFSNLVPIGPGAKEEMLDKMKTKKIMETIFDLQKIIKADIVGRRPLWTLVGSSGFCPVGYKTLTIDSNGDYLPCRRLPISLGNAKRDSFFKIWFTSEFLLKMREREKYVEICGKCKKAEECGGCRAIANAVLGNPFAPDPSCWLHNK